jgi:DnaJ family protein C protein 2
VPNLGEPTTALGEVFRFYKYWDSFETWRDFSQYTEYDVREAADRYEKRYMEKENKKVTDKYTKKERARIIKLSELAYKRDPRIKKYKEEEEMEKKRKKQEHKDIKDRARKEIQDKIKEQEDIKQKEIDRLAEEEKKAKQVSQDAQRFRREVIKEFISTCVAKMPGTKYDRFFCEEFVKKLKKTEDIQDLIAKLNTFSSKEAFDNFEEMTMTKEKKAELERDALRKEDEKRRQEETKKIHEWSSEELSRLSKGIVKFPSGTTDRWKLIADFVGDRTQKQVMAKATEISQRFTQGKAK